MKSCLAYLMLIVVTATISCHPANDEKTLIIQHCLDKMVNAAGTQYLNTSKFILVDDSLTHNLQPLYFANKVIPKQKIKAGEIKVYYPGIKGVDIRTIYLAVKLLNVKPAKADVEIELPNTNLLLIFKLEKINSTWKVKFYNEIIY